MTTCKANSCYDSTNYSKNNYCSYHESCLSKLREYKSIDNIQELETFTTWFNGNCGYVISGSSSYSVWIVIYEPKHKAMSENLSSIRYKDSYSYLSEARDKAQQLKSKLQNDGWYDAPMLEVHPYADRYERFCNIITSPYVTKDYLPCYHERFLWSHSSRAPVNAELYLKPLDIVWVKRSSEKWEIGYNHVGIYLGKWDGENWMCHLDDDRGAETITWERFLKNGTCEELIRYHPIIPFKYLRRIAEQIAWAADNNFRKGSYSLRNRNCEHFSNMLIYGINYSKQIENSNLASVSDGLSTFNEITLSVAFSVLNFKSTSVRMIKKNNDKGSTIKLSSEMDESNNKLGERDNWLSDQIKANIEVPPKECCRIM